jgi:metallo-beta-lactamase class B
MIQKFRSMLVVILLFFVGSLAAQNVSPVPFVDSAWVRPYKPFRIAGNLYYVGTYDLACFLITSTEGHILINTGLAESVPMIQESVADLGFKFSDIRILLTTQAHFDHVAGLAEIKKITGAKMMVNAADAQVLKDGGNSDFIFGGKGSTFAPVVPDQLLKDGDKIQIGKTTLVALHHPGHTKGSTSFLLDVTDEKRTWTVLIANMPTILPQTRIFGMPNYPNIGADYKMTLESLKNLQFDLWVASHGSQFGLHAKRRPGDQYHPEVFADRKGYDSQVSELYLAYENRRAEESKK